MISSDSHEVSQLNELKIDLDAIAVIAHYKGNSDIIMDEQMPIFGGYAGGIEETTIVDIATHINSVVMSTASWHLDGPADKGGDLRLVLLLRGDELSPHRKIDPVGAGIARRRAADDHVELLCAALPE